MEPRRPAIRLIAILFGLLFVFLLIARVAGGNDFVADIPIPEEMKGVEDLLVQSDNEQILQIAEYSVEEGHIRVRVRPEQEGTAGVVIRDPKDPEYTPSDYFRIGKTKTVMQESTGEFKGDRLLILCAFVFLSTIAYLMLDRFRKSGGTALYSYGTLHSIGFGIFSAYAAFILVFSLIRLYVGEDGYNMRMVFYGLTSAAQSFMLYTSPFLLLFAVLMTVSNISLIRHEGRRMRNMLGILIGAMLVGGIVFEYLFNRYVSGLETEVLIHDIINSVYCTVFVYFECILIGAIICGIRAARYVPKQDQDYIVILGCKIFGDGTLTPLLRGRVDRAVEFAKEQEKATGKIAVFVPSGGQGTDEVLSEGQAMKNYMLSIGIEEKRILAEVRSRNTYENMEFSKELIEKRDPGAKVCFSTTNYHVFRSGLWAQMAGLNAEGMGSHTKWYFWPNAFMRECVGLLANHVKAELILLAAFTAFYAALTILLK